VVLVDVSDNFLEPANQTDQDFKEGR